MKVLIIAPTVLVRETVLVVLQAFKQDAESITVNNLADAHRALEGDDEFAGIVLCDNPFHQGEWDWHGFLEEKMTRSDRAKTIVLRVALDESLEPYKTTVDVFASVNARVTEGEASLAFQLNELLG